MYKFFLLLLVFVATHSFVIRTHKSTTFDKSKSVNSQLYSYCLLPPFLPQDTTNHLLNQISTAPSTHSPQYHSARSKLVTYHLRLVSWVVSDTMKRRSRNTHTLQREDLISEGSIGLMKAIDTFSPQIAQASGSSFATFATYHIRGQVLRSILKKDEMIRVSLSWIVIAIVIVIVENLNPQALTQQNKITMLWFEQTPEHVNDAITKVKRLYKKNKNLSPSAVAIRTGLTLDGVNNALKVDSRRRNGGYDELDHSRLHDTMTIDSSHDQNGNANDANAKKNKNKFLSQYLSSLESEALGLRFGLFTTTNSPSKLKFRDYEAEVEATLFGGGEIEIDIDVIQNNKKKPKVVVEREKKGALSFKEVGLAIGVSAEYGRRICNNAITKLQLAVKNGELSQTDMLNYLVI